MTATERAEAPYADGHERLLDELHRVDLLLRRHLESWWAEREGAAGEFRGLFVSDAEVDRLLATPQDGGPPAGASRSRSDRALERAIGLAADRIDARRERADRETRLGRLADEFDLDRRALDALLLALATDLDPKYEKVYGYLQDDVTRTRPSVGLLVRVLATDRHAELADRGRFERGSTLVDEGLVTVDDDGRPFVGRPVRVPRRVGNYLVGGDALPGRLADAATVVGAGGSLDGLELDDGQRDRLALLRDRLATSGEPVMAALVGPAERTAAGAVEAVVSDGRPVLRIVAEALLGGDRAEVVADLRREARLRSAAVHVRGLGAAAGSDEPEDGGDGDPTATVVAVVQSLDDIPGPVFLTGDASVDERLEPALANHRLAVVPMPVPTHDRRVAIWASQDLPEGVDPAGLADAFRLTSGQIADAVATARAMAGGDPDGAALRAGCRAQAGRGLEEHAREIEPTYGWDDIVLPPDTEARLREAAAQVRHRGTVFESWGFADRYSGGRGVALLFTGPSGTGKTMAAEVIANDVGLPLYAIDLATMLSKYVGETEENLRRVFDAAERSSAILFFDEADALFGQRSEVSDAHDRYANVEIDYLLQRLEAHDGCVVLASNLAENIDDAFRRRINVSVEFPHPDEPARAEIWHGAFPDATPTTDLDVDFLAGFELTGGNITNVAMAAAFMAAEDGEPVGMAHAVRAVRRELQKDGRLFDLADFEPYREALEG